MRNLAIIKNNRGSIMTLSKVGEKIQITHGMESFEITREQLLEITDKLDENLLSFHELMSKKSTQETE